MSPASSVADARAIGLISVLKGRAGIGLTEILSGFADLTTRSNTESDGKTSFADTLRWISSLTEKDSRLPSNSEFGS